MLTKWEQLEAWLRDNNFTRWILWKENPAEHPDGKGNFKILDSVQFAVSDFEDKIAMTKKYLTMSGGRAWAVGTGKTAGETICEIRLEQDNYAPAASAGVGMTQDAIGQMRESIKAELMADWEKKEYERKRAELDKERKEFEADKQSALGLVVGYLAPVAKAIMQKRSLVAGVDNDAPVHTDPIQPIVADRPADTPDPDSPDAPEESAEQQFSPEDEAKWVDLINRFVAVEPQALDLFEAVVNMAESGDSMYGMAKNILLKK